jgi:hypothetical protein
MTARISENLSAWFADRTILAVVGSAMPPRDPNDDDDEDEDEDEDEDDDDEPDDDGEPAVVREPDE